MKVHYQTKNTKVPIMLCGIGAWIWYKRTHKKNEVTCKNCKKKL